MPRLSAIVEPVTIRDARDPWHPPGPSRGVVAEVRQDTGGYLGPRYSRGTDQEREITSEKAASGPRDVVFPWFLPYFDSTTLGESEVMRLAYRQMMADPRVKTAVLGKLFGIASLSLRLLPADKKDKFDQFVAKHIEWMLTERLRGTMPELIWSVLSGSLIDGYSMCEKVWTLEEKGKYAGKYSLTKLKPKDTNNDLVLQTDEYRNVIGVLGLRYNGGREFSPAHFLIYRHLPLYDNPTGMSDLRAAYQSYWMLDTVMKLRAMSAEKYAIPFLLGHYLNTTVKTSLEDGLKKAKSQRWLSIPESCRVEAINMAGSSEDVFKSFVMDLRHDIFLSIQGAVLQTIEGETTDARGNSQVHKSTSDKFVWFLASTVESLLNDRECGLIKDCVDLNYVVSEYPKAILDSVDVNELQQEMTIDTGLHQLGLDLSKDELYERYGRKPPESEDDRLAAQAALPPSQPGGEKGPGTPPGSALPFEDLDPFTSDPKLMPPQEGAARPFRRFAERWRDYLTSAS